LSTAERANAVVTSLFPSQVRDKILDDANNDATNDKYNSDKDKVSNVWSFDAKRGGGTEGHSFV
jgi:hypothetical protein